MAWYAELKRRKWYCIVETDMISWYSQKLYDDWYDSLTDEQKQKLEEYRKAKAEKRRRESREALAKFGVILSTMNRLTNGKMHNYLDVVDIVNKIDSLMSKY